MSLFKNLFKKRKDVSLLSDEALITKAGEQDEDEIVAVIAATMAAMEEEEEIVAAITGALSIVLGKDPGEFIVRNIKRTSDMESIWAHVGRMQLMR
ncbi:MAG TPA: hypothetical protein PLV23_02600 [Sedimentibacter sp.]|jgi:hypothetical protein|nr:hypothetical protein [Sedimentibacter sp.]HHY99618.1 hypothetical protein [Tissierellia bacterium]HOK48921.1 hypothetical protein [Sedimentibacter sp.]HOW22502.1 hypothetical protein [Sedimentibacter sp.]HRC80521.1 hypothetical protein [Sedimentibacter sp.]